MTEDSEADAAEEEAQPFFESQHVFSVFYKDYVNDVAILSSEPEPQAADRIGPLAEVLLQHADNFLGVIDKNDQILHAYLDDDEQSVILELLFPEDAGSMRLKCPRNDAMAILMTLPAAFTETLLPGAQFIS